jgi:ABC-type cobalamin transport system ATPase subunit
MKTFIIATILCAGVLLQPQMVQGTNAQIDNTAVTVAAGSQTAPQPLDKTTLNAAVGGMISCFGEIGENGTSVYQTCCANFWIIRICVSVYLGEVSRPLTEK